MAGTGAAVRNERVAYLYTGSAYYLMGTGFESLDDSLNPTVDEVTYINEVSATKTITGYAPEWSFDATVIKDDAVVSYLRNIGKTLATGGSAESNVVIFDAWDVVTGVAPAIKYPVTISMDSIGAGAGGEKLTMSGTLLGNGDPVPGDFTIATKTFVAD